MQRLNTWICLIWISHFNQISTSVLQNKFPEVQVTIAHFSDSNASVLIHYLSNGFLQIILNRQVDLSFEVFLQSLTKYSTLSDKVILLFKIQYGLFIVLIFLIQAYKQP